jgi:hypothetical protein
MDGKDSVIDYSNKGIKLEDLIKMGIPKLKDSDHLGKVNQIGIICLYDEHDVPSWGKYVVYVSGILTKEDKNYLLYGNSFDAEDDVISPQQQVNIRKIYAYEKIKEKPFETIR